MAPSQRPSFRMAEAISAGDRTSLLSEMKRSHPVAARISFHRLPGRSFVTTTRWEPPLRSILQGSLMAPSRGSAHHDLAAVDDQRLARHAPRLLREEEDDGVRDVLGLDLPSERGQRRVVGDDLLGPDPLLPRAGADVLIVPYLRALEDVPRRDAVHADPRLPELESPAPHEVDLRRLGRVVGRVVLAGVEAGLAREVDDPSPGALADEDARG